MAGTFSGWILIRSFCGRTERLIPSLCRICELRFSEIDHLELIKGMMLVWVKGTNFPAVGAPLARVRNGLLLLDKLIERGITVISSSPLWVPLATPHVASVVSAAVGLPKAKLRR